MKKFGVNNGNVGKGGLKKWILVNTMYMKSVVSAFEEVGYDGYWLYEMELENNKELKVDCTYEDVSIISTIVDNKIVNSFDVTPDYLPAMAKAIIYVLNLNNKSVKVTRNISDEPGWRYSVLFYNNILTLSYIDDEHEKSCSKIDITIEDNEVEKLTIFFNTVLNLEKN